MVALVIMITIGVIPAHEVAVSFEPTTSLDSVNGELTFGGTDPHKISGSIHYAYVESATSANGLGKPTDLHDPPLAQADHAHRTRVLILGDRPVDPVRHFDADPVKSVWHRGHGHHARAHR